VAVAGGQAGAFLPQQRIRPATGQPGAVGHVLPGHRPVLGLAGEQEPHQHAGRLAALPVPGRAGAGSLGGHGWLVLLAGQDRGVRGVLAGVLLVLAVVLVATVGETEQEQVPGKRRTDGWDAVDAGHQQPGRRIKRDVGCPKLSAIELPAASEVSTHGYQGVLWGRVRCSARTATAATAMKVSKPSSHSQASTGLSPAAWAMVQHVEAERGAVGEHGEGAQPAGVVDGAVDAVAVLGSTGSHHGVLPGVLGVRAAPDSDVRGRVLG
jgi:hypothetical protein